MEPITDYFENLKSEFSKFIITYDYFKVDIDEPENIYIQYLNDPSLVLEGHSFHLNGNDLIGSYFSDLFKQTQDEITENLKIPIDYQEQIKYLDEIIDFSSKIEESIVKRDGKWTCLEGVNVGFNYDELPSYEKEFLSNSMKAFKTTFRNLIAFVKLLGYSIKPPEHISSKNTATTNGNFQIDQTIDLTQEILTRAFEWKRKNEFKRDIIVLFELLTDEKYNIIPKEVDFNTFCYAFSGKYLNGPLRIKWLVTGKNKLTSKSSLFHFISKLEDKKLIEAKEWNTINYGPLYRKISAIFIDKENNPFTIEGLKSSRSQGLEVECAMQEEIDKIVAIVFNLASDNLPK